MVSDWSCDPRDTRGIYSAGGATNVEDAFAVTDHTEDLALDCDTDAANAIADVLGTLIRILIEKGIIRGTVINH